MSFSLRANSWYMPIRTLPTMCGAWRRTYAKIRILEINILGELLPRVLAIFLRGRTGPITEDPLFVAHLGGRSFAFRDDGHVFRLVGVGRSSCVGHCLPLSFGCVPSSSLTRVARANQSVVMLGLGFVVAERTRLHPGVNLRFHPDSFVRGNVSWFWEFARSHARPQCRRGDRDFL